MKENSPTKNNSQLACRCGCGRPVNPADGSRPQPRYLHGHHRRKHRRYRKEWAGHETQCWIWQLAIAPNGYGLEREPNGGKMTYAHRRSYEQHRGPIPPNLQVDHLCSKRTCVNPEHLELVTPKENIRRGAGTRRDPDAVRAIRGSSDRLIQIAKTFGISPSHVSRIKRGLVWADVA